MKIIIVIRDNQPKFYGLLKMILSPSEVLVVPLVNPPAMHESSVRDWMLY